MSDAGTITTLDTLNFQGYTILIIDDNPTNLGVIVGYLKDYGFKILVARNGKVGYQRARHAQPDLILLDVLMPEMNGFETCQRLKADDETKSIPVIFMTALNSTEDKVKGFTVGGVDYVTKPIEQEEILARISTHLRLRDLTQSLHTQAETLQKTNEELTEVLNNLRATQKQLVEAEKMAALGNLVAGVAHEINTPIGIGVTMASTLVEETNIFFAAYKAGQLKRSVVDSYVEVAQEGSHLILNNLQRAAKLVQSFKQVAVDQTSLEKRTFLAKNYIEETIRSLEPQLKSTRHTLKVRGSNEITLDSYPGALSQIVTNLIINSIVHAYEEGEAGHLEFRIIAQEKQILIEYSDDGCGIPPENLNRVFEPFFTTARSKQGTGLGLHIVFNLVTQNLKGFIRCESEVGIGTKFILELPRNVEDNEPIPEEYVLSLPVEP